MCRYVAYILIAMSKVRCAVKWFTILYQKNPSVTLYYTIIGTIGAQRSTILHSIKLHKHKHGTQDELQEFKTEIPAVHIGICREIM